MTTRGRKSPVIGAAQEKSGRNSSAGAGGLGGGGERTEAVEVANERKTVASVLRGTLKK